VLTYVDASVLIAATRATGTVAERALEILDDPNRTFASSEYVRLEVLPKAVFFNRSAETRFYEEFFAGVAAWARPTEELLAQAFNEACAHGLAGMDALHVAAAASLGADELVTVEGVNKPIHRTSLVRVRTTRG
jgi:predicted nucleic acid-binding protein